MKQPDSLSPCLTVVRKGPSGYFVTIIHIIILLIYYHFSKIFFHTGIQCKTCRKNASKKMCQAGTQVDINESLKENLTVRTNVSSSNLVSENDLNPEESNTDNSEKICPLCGICYGNSTFTAFHEHVLSHFNNDENEF